MKRYILIFTLLVASLGNAQDLNTYFSKVDAFLKTNVKAGKVDYKSIHSDPSALNELIRIAEGLVVKSSEANNYQAFWINNYNLGVIKGIIDNYPTKSPLDNTGFFDKTTYNFGGKKMTLNDIEHKLLRAKFKDPRFHFVLVCGAIGCPPLINEAYLPNTLNTQLDVQTKKAINGEFLKVNTKRKKVEASEIMKWYKEDFTMNGKTEIDFINTYRKDKISDDYKLSYFPYNWSLNKQ
ncbi:DUF547 domain-containing protein [uncultured Winogradskyella sp.]|uniref:DUF547 domain-containing protein n=1 Tax=uncultured Winogradskyella sp. TaxID=395353 RepID=UPI0026079217|nr:DUF547 domain-containing protein [uncultured Winogradskyella sp.]